MAKILIATDGSRNGTIAVDYGVRLAALIKAEVLGLYVVSTKSLEIYGLEHHDNIEGYEDFDARMRKEGEGALAHLMSLCEKDGVKASTKVERGHPSDEIVRIADTEQVAMIVLGSLGKTGLEHMLMGSVSETVVRKAHCPVLVVRGNVQL